MGRLPLEGIRVVDFTWVGAGPMGTRILADSGAEVIKVESGIRPDVLRLSAPYKDKIPGINRSGYFANRNSSKRSLMLDMSKPQARELIKRLVKTADIVSNSFTPNTMEKWGLGYEDIRKIKEDIIYLNMPMQGTTGPHRDYMGFGATMNALIGFNHLTGLPDREPIGTGTNYPDHVPNPTHAAFALMAALRYRNRTGRGQCVEVAQTESALNILAVAVMEAANNGRIQERQGNRESYAAPHGAYPCRGEDRWCVIACRDDRQWLRLLEAAGLEHLADDPRFSTFAARIKHADELDAIIGEWTKRHEAEEVMRLLQRHGVPAGVVQNAEDLVERDEQLKLRNQFVRLEHPEMGLCIYNSMPFKLSETPVVPRKAAPLLGEDNEYICKEIIGLSDEEYRALQEADVFR